MANKKIMSTFHINLPTVFLAKIIESKFFIPVPKFMLVTSGMPQNHKTEILKMGNDGDEPPKYPNDPRMIYAAAGGFLGGNNFIICGGQDIVEYTVTNKCFKLGLIDTFAVMKKNRSNAASIMLKDKLWILGGWDGNGIDRYSSTEYIFSDGRSEEGPPMPIAIKDHVIIKINYNTFLVIGGYGNNGYYNNTWFYSNGKWSDGPALVNKRSRHSVGIVRDSVTLQEYFVVTGGLNGDRNVEILRSDGIGWEAGKLST